MAYTYGYNNYKTDEIINSDLSHTSSFLVSPKSEYFKIIKQSIVDDFKFAKKFNPDFIIVLPHWGTQFLNKPDSYQIEYNNIFKECGADIILGSHTHSIQPIQISHSIHNNKKVVTVFSPGNFCNIYHKFDGDASALIEVYIDKSEKKISGVSIVPMWINSSLNGNYAPVPIYDIFTNSSIKNYFNFYDIKRINEVQKLITKIMLKNELDINKIQKRYFLINGEYYKPYPEQITIIESFKNNIMYRLIDKYNNICFIGDSITEGTKNGGCPWYEPLISLIKGNIVNISVGGGTTKTFLQDVILKKLIKFKSDLYVIAIGTNDIRYRNSNVCAMNENQYIENLDKIKNNIIKINKNAVFLWIAPWISMDGDKNSALQYDAKIKMLDKYCSSLEVWCQRNNDFYINGNNYIKRTLDLNPNFEYLVDAIHPNSTKGIQLYAKAILDYSKK